MQGNTILRTLSITCVGVLLAGCSDQQAAPTEAEAARQATADVVQLQALPEAFTVRAPLDPYFINQPSEMMIRSTARTDFAIQRLVTPPGGGGGWHTHPGPSFGIVEVGQVMITRYTKKDGCVSTVFGPGEPAGAAYFEVAGEVHRATVVSEVDAVEYKARFFTPLGAPFGNPAPDPGC